MSKHELILYEANAPCLAKTKDGTNCKNGVRQSDRIYATRLIHKLKNVSASSAEERDRICNILDLLLCGTHQKLGRSIPQLETLLERHESQFIRWAQEKEPLMEVEMRSSDCGSRTSVIDKLVKQIKNKESERGVVYIFTCADLPGMVKVGYVQEATAVPKRITEWGKCFSKPTLAFRMDTIFPHRLEELVHCELKDKRLDVACLIQSCSTDYHNEWFRCDLSEAVSIVDGWCALLNDHRLYGKTSRQLEPMWRDKVRPDVVVTAQNLLHTIRADQLADTLSAISITETISTTATEQDERNV